GQLYGSVSTRDLAAIIGEAGFTVDRSQIELNAPIKMIGMHKIPVALHPDVEVSVNVNVARNGDEAERQARGEDVVVRREAADEADETPAEGTGAFFERPEPSEAADEDQGAGASKAG